MNSKIDGAVEAAFSDFRRAGASGPLDKVYADIAASFAHMTPNERKTFLEHLNKRVHQAHLTPLDIDGIDTKNHKVLLADHQAHKVYTAATVHHPKPVPAHHADYGFRLATSPMGAPKGMDTYQTNKRA